MPHAMDIRVYYEDTDAGGIVYYANYLKFCERGRTELLRSAGFENKPLMERMGFIFVVRHLEADYLKPCYLDDIVRLETTVSAVKKASFEMKQTLFRRNGGVKDGDAKDDGADERIFEMTVMLVCVGTNGKPVRLTDDLREALLKDG